MRHPSDHLTPTAEPRCPACSDTGRASVKTIDDVSMVAWCRCPAGTRALDLELAQRRAGVVREPAPPTPGRVAVPVASEPPISFGPAAVPIREPEPIPLRPVHDRPPIHVVTHEAPGPGTRVAVRPAQLPDAQVVAIGYKADERLGVICYLTLRIRGEQIEVPCDRDTADAFAANLAAGRSPRYRLALEPSRD